VKLSIEVTDEDRAVATPARAAAAGITSPADSSSIHDAGHAPVPSSNGSVQPTAIHKATDRYEGGAPPQALLDMVSDTDATDIQRRLTMDAGSAPSSTSL
jgi:hypothetical protein